MKKETLLKELKRKYRKISSYYLFILSVIPFTVFDIVSNLGLLIPLIINYILLFANIHSSIWAYRKRIEAIPFAISETISFILIVGNIFVLQRIACPDNQSYYIGASISFLISLFMMNLGALFEKKNWERRLKSWIDNKKIDIEKGYLNILVIVLNSPKDYRMIYWSAITVPILGVVVTRLGKTFNFNRILLQICSYMLIVIISFLIGQQIMIIRKLLELQRKHNYIFQTEYRKFVKKEEQR